MKRIEKTVFLSYRRTNASWALAIFQDLSHHGYDVFFDFNGIASGDFERVILENINARAHFLVLLTPSALERCDDPEDWLRREIETALSTQRNIVPVMLEGFDFSSPGIVGQLPETLAMLKRYNGLRVPADYFAEAMHRLRSRFLNVPLAAVLQPASPTARQAARVQQAAAVAAPAVPNAELVGAAQGLVVSGIDLNLFKEYAPVEAPGITSELQNRLVASAPEALSSASPDAQLSARPEYTTINLDEQAHSTKALFEAEPKTKRFRQKLVLFFLCILVAISIAASLYWRYVSSSHKEKLPTERPRPAQIVAPLSQEPQSTTAPKVGDTKVNPKDMLIYVWIPPGKFKMGCSTGDEQCVDETPHQVKISRGFWLGQTEVTQAAYKRLTGTNPSYFKIQGSTLPVEGVHWDDAYAYCQAAGMRLPAEAEWEYAARAGNSEIRYGEIDRISWYKDNSRGMTHKVAQKQPNSWGLYDMLGNVWEWVADWYGEYPTGSITDPKGPARQIKDYYGHVMRGASWYSVDQYVRASARFSEPEPTTPHLIGIRCAGN